MTYEQKFLEAWLPTVQAISKQTGWRPALQQSQLAVESGYGQSPLAVKCHNYGGIRYVGQAGAVDNGSGFACYSSVAAFIADYTRVQKLSYYNGVRAQGTLQGQVAALAASPYDAGHYGGQGQSLAAVIDSYGLAGQTVTAGKSATYKGVTATQQTGGGISLSGQAEAGTLYTIAAMVALGLLLAIL